MTLLFNKWIVGCTGGHLIWFDTIIRHLQNNTIMSVYTKYFDNCKAVFQGGGCKAIAYVGAYKEAYKRGVFFSELSGTSAGSLFAAFIAAGAKPDYLEKLVREVNFSDFIKDYKKPGLASKYFVKTVLPTELSDLSDYLTKDALVNDYGIFSMDGILEFVNKQLRILTGLDKDVTFADIVPDLHIVSGDLKTHKVKTWNRKNTPNEPIAKAVCASCAIPLFFKPIDRRYVDGGVLCNLPNFIFLDEPHYNKILSFRFTSSTETAQFKTFGDYGLSLIDTIIEGADNLHEYLNLESYDVTIEVDGVSSVDFKKLNPSIIDKLIQNGEKAASDFFDKESIYSSDSRKRGVKILHSLEQIHSVVAYLGYERHKHIFISLKDTFWSWCLFPTMLKWINNGSQITVFVSKDIDPTNPEREKARRRMIQAMGCKLIEQDRIVIEGFFFKGNSHWRGVSFLRDEDGSIFGKFYNDRLDGRMISARVNELRVEATEEKCKPINIKSIKPERIINELKKDPIYANAEFSFKRLKPSEVVFMNPFIRALKYKQIDAMFEMYTKIEGLDPFSPAALIFPNKKESLIGPPVVEERNGKYYVIEGNTRFVYAYRHGIEKLNALVVRNVTTQLPCNEDMVVTVDKVLLSDKKLEGMERYGKFEYALYRHIEERLHPKETYMK